MSLKNVCIVGATGAVGLEILKVLRRRNFPIGDIRLLSSSRSAGKKLKFGEDDIPVSLLSKDSFKGFDIALFSAGSSVSLEYARYALDTGCIVVDNSSAFRMDKSVPLVVPEVNKDKIKSHSGIIANPNCSTIILLMGIYPIEKLSRIKRIVCATYQSASGAGKRAMDELIDQSRSVLLGTKIEKNIFPHQIAFNLFSHDTKIDADGYNVEERKMINEVRKILDRDDIKIGVTCIRVPIMRAHCEVVNLELEDELSLSRVREAISNFPGASLLDDRKNNHFPMPIEASDKDNVLVGRLRRDLSCHNGISLFISGDQLLKGAALNAVQIAESLL